MLMDSDDECNIILLRTTGNHWHETATARISMIGNPKCRYKDERKAHYQCERTPVAKPTVIASTALSVKHPSL